MPVGPKIAARPRHGAGGLGRAKKSKMGALRRIFRDAIANNRHNTPATGVSRNCFHSPPGEDNVRGVGDSRR